MRMLGKWFVSMCRQFSLGNYPVQKARPYIVTESRTSLWSKTVGQLADYLSATREIWEVAGFVSVT